MKDLDKIFEWIQNKKNRKRIVLIVLALFGGPLVITYGLYKIPYINDFFVPPWKAGEILGYLGAFYTLVGTAIFSYLALRLNYIQKQDNEASQTRLDDFNMRLLKIDEQKLKPVIDIETGYDFGSGGNLNGTQIELKFKNIGDNAVKCLKINEIAVNCNENSCKVAGFYLGGISSKDSIDKKLIVIGADLITPKKEIRISFNASYQDVLDISYLKEYNITLNYDSYGKLKVFEETVKNANSN